MTSKLATRETTISRRVDYSETDQMGVVYHARYLVWLDVARTEHLRQSGLSYLEMEGMGYRLVVSELEVKYRQPARYDDFIRVRVWVHEVESRRVTFGYLIENETGDQLLATATTSLIALDKSFRPTRLPEQVAKQLIPTSQPVRG